MILNTDSKSLHVLSFDYLLVMKTEVAMYLETSAVTQELQVIPNIVQGQTKHFYQNVLYVFSCLKGAIQDSNFFQMFYIVLNQGVSCAEPC
ncbi:hypothetical protein FKM82_012759 [Ascaphus truei]